MMNLETDQFSIYY